MTLTVIQTGKHVLVDTELVIDALFKLEDYHRTLSQMSGMQAEKREKVSDAMKELKQQHTISTDPKAVCSRVSPALLTATYMR